MAQPNVVIFYTDDQGTIDAGCYGSEDLYTPYMDSLAENGVMFTQAYAHSVCCPSRAQLLTGRYTQRTGINNWCSNHPSDENGISLDRNEITLAQKLKENGYRTALFGKWHLGANLDHGPNVFGFDAFVGHRGGFIDNFHHKFLKCKKGQPPFHDLWVNDEEINREGVYFPDLVADQAKMFLEQNKDNPFFLYLPFNLPHYPYQPDEDFAEKYKDLPYPRNLYAPMVSTVDRRIGEVMEKLDELGLTENTLVIYMSDNGHSEEDSPANWDYYFSAHGGGGNTGKWTGSKNTLLEGGIRVPAIISMPGTISSGEQRDQIITNMDFLPTVLELCDIPLPDKTIDGYSLWDIINDKNAPENYEELCLQWQNMWMARQGNWKLLDNNKREGSPTEVPFLANLEDEYPERENYIEKEPDIADKLRKIYEEWSSSVFTEE